MNRTTGDTKQLQAYNTPASPTTDKLVLLQTKIYSPAGSMNGATGDLECLYTEELRYPRHTGELGYLGQTRPTTDQLVLLQLVLE